MNERPSTLLALLALGGCLLCSTANAKDQIIDWSFNALPQNHQVDVLQCQSIVFDWTGGGSGGVIRSVWEFPDEVAFNMCDFSNAKELSAASERGSYALQNDDTVDVTKRWFGCKTPGHCSVGNMKLAIKIRPFFIEKLEQSECVGGTVDIQKNEESLKMCRKRCKRRRGCIAIEYNTATLKNCALYSQSPERRKSDAINPSARCELAATSCDDIEEIEGGDGDGDGDGNDDEQTTPSAPTLLIPELKPMPDLVGVLIGFASISGYGRAGTTGGEGGRVVKVDNREDFAKVIKLDEPLTVLVDGMIDMYDPLCPCKTTLSVSSDTTIIGLGKSSGIKRGGLKIRGVKLERPPDWDPSEACICDEEEEEGREELVYPRDIAQLPADANPTNNVVIRNMDFSDCPVDCVGVETFAHHVWIDHNNFSNPSDGAVDIKRGSDLITVSWNHFQNAIKTMLFGHNDENGPQDIGRLRVTIQSNFFDKTEQRHPRVRFAEPVHVVNNYYRSNSKYGIGSAMDAGLFIEGNFFQDVAETIRTDVGSDYPLFIPGRFVEKGNIYERSGLPPPSGAKVEDPGKYYTYKSSMLEAKDVPSFVLEWGGAGVIY